MTGCSPVLRGSQEEINTFLFLFCFIFLYSDSRALLCVCVLIEDILFLKRRVCCFIIYCLLLTLLTVKGPDRGQKPELDLPLHDDLSVHSESPSARGTFIKWPRVRGAEGHDETRRSLK